MASRSFIAAAFALSGVAAFAQGVTLKSGDSADLFEVYWVRNCQSALKSFQGVEVVSGPAELKVALREQPVVARRQGCNTEVPGAMLVLSATGVAKEWDGTVRLRVHYATTDGDKMSDHSVKVVVVPAQQ